LRVFWAVESVLRSAAQTDRADDVEPRFADLAGESWAHLPAAIRRRFSRHLADGERIIYLGEVASTTLSWVGRIIAQLARIAGAPLPLQASGRMPVAVLVTGC
jgi:hypothetical protein